MILNGLKWSGIAFLLWLAWKIATASRTGSVNATSVVGFWQAAAFQWVNPKSWLISASAVGTFLHAEAAGPFVQSAYFGVLFVLAALPSCFVWLTLGASVQRTLQTERSLRLFNLTMGTLLAGSIIFFVW